MLCSAARMSNLRMIPSVLMGQNLARTGWILLFWDAVGVAHALVATLRQRSIAAKWNDLLLMGMTNLAEDLEDVAGDDRW